MTLREELEATMRGQLRRSQSTRRDGSPEAVRITTAHDDPYRTERSAYEVYEAEEAAKLVALRAAIARAIEGGRKP
jgi:hypothetical protein